MTRADDASLRFPCPRCFSWLQAPRRAAGTRRRSPRCQFVLEVPQQSRTRATMEAYPLSEGSVAAESPAYITVVCPVCRTRMYATEEQIGQEMICPDCGRLSVVPPPAPALQPRAAAPAVEEYPLCEEAEAALDVDRLDEEMIRVYCRVCGTMMYATESDVGHELVCPDCGVSTKVRRPEQSAKKPPRSAGEIGEYSLAAEDLDAIHLIAEPQAYAAVICTVCHTRLHATREQVGGRLVCPDCGSSNVIPPPPPPVRTIDVMANAGEGYAVASQPAAPPVATPRRAPVQSGHKLEPHSQRPTLPRRPFVIGTFSFPFVRAWGAALRLLSWALASFACAAAAGTFIKTGHPAGVALGGLFAAMAFLLSFGWLVFAAANGIAVLRDTANGCDEIQNWPGLGFIDWMAEPLYLVSAMLVSAFPGVVLRWLPAEFGAANFIVTPLGAFILFPFVLLSMLENGSPAGPISWPVCRTLWRAWKGWVSFYLVAAPLLITAAVLAIAASAAGRICGIVAMPVIATATWLIYFRLLGRLAWYCAEQDRAADEEDEEDEDDDESDDDLQEDQPTGE